MLEFSPFKEIELQESADLGQGPVGAGQQLQVGEEQVDGECDPDLAEDGVSGNAQESLDLEVLLDPFEKQLDLPSLVIDLCDRRCRQGKVVGEKDIVLLSFWIPITDAPQLLPMFLSGGTIQEDGLVTGQPFGLENGAAFEHAERDVSFEAGHEGDLLFF